MRQRKTIFLQYLLSLLLVICLTAGCVAPARPQASAPLAKESAAQESTQSYEQYEKKTIDAQASFDPVSYTHLVLRRGQVARDLAREAAAYGY